MKHILQKAATSLLLMLFCTSMSAEVQFEWTIADGVKGKFEVYYRIYDELANQYGTSGAENRLKESFVKWECDDYTISRANPCLAAKVRLGDLSLLDDGLFILSEVYVQWNGTWKKLGTIESYRHEWYYRMGLVTGSHTYLFYKTHNTGEESGYGTFCIPVPTEESGNENVALFHYFPSTKMVKECVARGGNSSFKLKIVTTAYADYNWRRQDGSLRYRVTYEMENGRLQFEKPSAPTLGYANTTTQLIATTKIQSVNENCFNTLRDLQIYPLGYEEYNISYDNGQTSSYLIRTPEMIGKEGVKNVIDYDMGTYGRVLNGTYTVRDYFKASVRDDADVVYEGGRNEDRNGRIVIHGYDITWPEDKIVASKPLYSAKDALATFNSDDQSVKISWKEGEVVYRYVWTGDMIREYKRISPYPMEHDSYAFFYRAEIPEESTMEVADVNNAEWKYLSGLQLKDYGTRNFKQEALLYNKKYTYAIVVVPMTVNSADYEKDRTSLPPALTTLLPISTEPKIAIDIKQDLSVRDKISFTFSPAKVPYLEGKAKFTIYRRVQGDADASWTKIEDLELTNNGQSKGSFTDKNAEGCTVYEYKIGTYVKDESVNLDNELTCAPVPLTVPERSHVTSVEASKGERDNSVIVNWEAMQVGSRTTTYTVSRRPANSTEEFQAIHTVKGTANKYSYEDKNADAGQYYEYKVEAYTEGCDAPAEGKPRRAGAQPSGENLMFSNATEEIGFSLAKGVISGRISYGTGTSVGGVKVGLTRQADDQDMKLTDYSQLLKNGGTISWETTAKQMRTLAGEQQPFTLQMWVQPSAGQSNQPLVTVPGLGSLLVTSNNDYATLTLSGQSFQYALPMGAYSHINLAVDGNTAMLVVNGDTTCTDTVTLPTGTWNDKLADADKVSMTLGGGNFSGYLREVRLWSRILTSNDILTTYNRPLSGLETGLAIYWPLDEGLARHAFDVSCTGGVKNKRHPALAVSVEPSTWVPTAAQLSLYGITNNNGEYTIRSVPFTGTGNTYAITPEKELHEFTPATLNAFVNKQALSLNNNNFTDNSSFIYTGVVTYKNTDIPVDSVTFEIDGAGVAIDGKPVMTDAQGHFTLSVPIGKHFIQAVRSDHVLSRYPEKGSVEFTAPGNLNFSDNTLVNVAGRINGGIDDAAAPLGFQQSVNRLGVATVTLALETETNNRFNLRQEADGWHHRAVRTPIETDGLGTINSQSWYSETEPTDIVIQTDAVTGEFSAMLPPLRYIVKSIKFVNGSPYNDVDFFKKDLPAVDARNPLLPSPDTLRVDGKKKEYTVQGRLVLNYRKPANIIVEQRGLPIGFYGDYEIEDPDDPDKYICLFDLVTEAEAQANPNLNKDDIKGYKYTQYPIFSQNRKYTFNIAARETYDYYNEDGEKTKTYTQVPSDGIIHINNGMSNCAEVANEAVTYNGKTYKAGDRLSVSKVDVGLSSDGVCTYRWICGSPNFSDDHTLPLSITLESGNKITPWEGNLPEKNGTFKGIVLGYYLTGKRFVTKGPDKPLYVLRDPGGAGSSATLTNDTLKTRYDLNSFSETFSEKFTKTFTAGVYTAFVAGSVAANAVVEHTNETNFLIDTKIGETASNTIAYDESHTLVTTISEKVSTPSDASHVGRLGDTYIGRSTNFFYGDGHYLKFRKKSDGGLELVDSTGLGAAISLGTSYYYSEYYLVKELMPEWKRLRNLTLEHKDSWAEVPKPSAIKDGRKHYYTIYKQGDSKFGQNNPESCGTSYIWMDDAKCTVPQDVNYIVVVPKEIESVADTIVFFNENIRNWESVIGQNEDDKVDAIKKGGGENISFSGGQTITKTVTTAGGDYDSDGYAWTATVTVGIRDKTEVKVNKKGVTTELEIKPGQIVTGGKKYNQTDIKKTISYTLTDKNALSALSISVYESPAGWGPIFITEGGQTMCPYEGATKCDYSTKNKGTSLDQATMRIEKCDMSVVSANVADVPNGETAFFTLKLYNNSETQSPSSYTLYPHPDNNLKGGQMMMDGLPIPSTGISFFMPYGSTTKTLALQQGDQSVTDFTYMIRLQSQGDSTRVHSDWRTLTAHFVPTSAKVDLETELAVINSKTDSTTLTLRNLDRNFTGLKGVRLQYRRKGSDAWTLSDMWVMDAYKKDYPTAKVLPVSGNVTKRLKFATDGIYELRAQTFSLFGTSDVTRESDTITIVQDCQKPRSLGTAGLETYLSLLNRNKVHVTFDEPINPAAISQAANITIRKVGTENVTEVMNEADYDIIVSDRDIYFSFHDAMLPKMHGNIYEFSVQDIPDRYGNLSDTLKWRMSVDFSSAKWAMLKAENTITKGTSVTDTIYIFKVETGHTFTITGQPNWIQLSRTEGSTSDIDEYLVVEATILPTAPIGTWNVNLELKDDNGIVIPLTYTVKVLGNVPEWTVDYSQYEDNMIVIGRVAAWSDELVSGPTMLVGAFDAEGNCRGYAYTDYTVKDMLVDGKRTDVSGYFNLVVFGNPGDGDLTFRIYNCQTGLTYDSVAICLPADTVVAAPFSPSSIFGSYEAPAILYVGDKLLQTLNLKKGWNWVSFYMEFLTNQPTIQDLFMDYASAITCIKTKTSFADIYQDETNGEYHMDGDLATQQAKRGVMYKIYASTDIDVPICNTVYSGRWSVTLNPGWNWIGAACFDIYAVSQIFENATVGDYIKGRTGYATYNDRGEWEGLLTAIVPGEGYQYLSMASEETFILGQSKRRAPELLSEQDEVSQGQFAENMTLVIQPKRGDDIVPNQSVRVYINGTLRGKSVTNEQGICYLTIAGNSVDEEASLSIVINETETVIPANLHYSNDAMIGTTNAPYILQIVVPEIAAK